MAGKRKEEEEKGLRKKSDRGNKGEKTEGEIVDR
jgi:hypothetical protein